MHQKMSPKSCELCELSSDKTQGRNTQMANSCGDTPRPSPADRTAGQKINKDVEELNPVDQQDWHLWNTPPKSSRAYTPFGHPQGVDRDGPHPGHRTNLYVSDITKTKLGRFVL